jgi:hypothetical protein
MIDHYGGNDIMVFFNDPMPTPDPARRTIAMREAARGLLRPRTAIVNDTLLRTRMCPCRRR